MEHNIDFDNMTPIEVWKVLEEMNLDKILGIDYEDFVFIASMPSNMSVEEITEHLKAYRMYKKINNQDENNEHNI